MKFSENWLRELVDVQADRAQLAHALTMAGLEVEELTPLGEGLGGVVVAEIIGANILNIAGCNTNIGVTSPDIYQQCFPGALALSVALNTGSLIPKDVSVYNKDIKYTVYRSTQVANSVCFQGATRKLNPASNTWALTCHSEGNLEGIHQNCGEALNGRSVFEKRQDITA